MPGGSEYRGDPDDLAAYLAVAEAAGATVKGAKNPYTSANGWMSTFLDPDGALCLRLSSEDRDELLAAGGAEVRQYGRNMPDFASLAEGWQADADATAAWFARAIAHAEALPPK